MGEQPILHGTHHFDMMYLPTKYYQNISEREIWEIQSTQQGSICEYGRTDGRTVAKLIAISPEPCLLRDKKEKEKKLDAKSHLATITVTKGEQRVNTNYSIYCKP